MEFMKMYEKWLSSPALSDQEKAQLESIRGDEKEIESRFFDQLAFGTLHHFHSPSSHQQCQIPRKQRASSHLLISAISVSNTLTHHLCLNIILWPPDAKS